MHIHFVLLPEEQWIYLFLNFHMHALMHIQLVLLPRRTMDLSFFKLSSANCNAPPSCFTACKNNGFIFFKTFICKRLMPIQFVFIASITMDLSFLKLSSACSNAYPVCFIASRTMDLSFFKLSSAYFNANPL